MDSLFNRHSCSDNYFCGESSSQCPLKQAATGKEELYGKKALVKTPLNPEGKVLYDGEIWAAHIENGSAEVGQEVVIVRLEGLKLYVKMERSE
ncbi:serine protease [Dehalococcoides mccartyi]|uniref:Serine protease n=1 Tax=Dehalococcoides mccartyi TaxID=61435 RepID=A0A2J1DTV6_9CHLR|nr:serine protease [Dehalococcoides mccartyi]